MKENNSTNPLLKAYEGMNRFERAAFRRNVCEKCDWTSEGVFYRKMRGQTRTTTPELEVINKLIKQIPKE